MSGSRFQLHDYSLKLLLHLHNSHRQVRYLLPKVISFVTMCGRRVSGATVTALLNLNVEKIGMGWYAKEEQREECIVQRVSD